jgi:hypothetical protein
MNGEPPVLLSLPLGYTSSLVHSLSKMKFQNQVVWNSLASLILKAKDKFDTRALSNIVYSLSEL